MTNLEKVEKLKEKAKVSYEEAKDALEACEWDMLDAIVKLEREGKIGIVQDESDEDTPAIEFSSQEQYAENHAGNQHSTQNTDTPQQIVESYQTYREEQQKKNKGKMDDFWNWCKKILKKSVDNKFVVARHGEKVMEIPVLLLVILLLASVWIILVVLGAGLFFGFSYSFAGPDLGKKDINDTMSKANDVADSIKNEFQKGKNN